jgi:hypothetical protein
MKNKVYHNTISCPFCKEKFELIDYSIESEWECRNHGKNILLNDTGDIDYLHSCFTNIYALYRDKFDYTVSLLLNNQHIPTNEIFMLFSGSELIAAYFLYKKDSYEISIEDCSYKKLFSIVKKIKMYI